MNEPGDDRPTPQAGGESLCRRCAHLRTITSGRGSVFLLCRLALEDHRFAKYPPQPLVRCHGFRPREFRDATGPEERGGEADDDRGVRRGDRGP